MTPRSSPSTGIDFKVVILDEKPVLVRLINGEIMLFLNFLPSNFISDYLL